MPDAGAVHAILYEGHRGGAAWLAGGAIAQTWRPRWQIAGYMIVLGVAVRFMHFALFSGTLLAPWYLAVDTSLAIAAAFFGYRLTRARQMAVQYGFLFRRRGLFGWVRHNAGS
ncbi:MAG: hypothetical protein HY056_03270 [Proteobacteria bacterium]|nr:hypothetical protein [Pseudomonadota bacterium]